MLASRGRNPRLTAYRKLMRQGNSLVIAPPPAFLKTLNVLKGEYVCFEYEPGANYFIVRAADPRHARRTTAEQQQLVLEEPR